MDEPMTLIERLRNPSWSPQSAETTLHIERTRADMIEAAEELERWRLRKRPVAFRVQSPMGPWTYYDHEASAVEAAEKIGSDYQALYVRDGT